MNYSYTEFNQRKPYMLKDSDFNFLVRVIDPDYNNNDNPYGELKLHRYTNIENTTHISQE